MSDVELKSDLSMIPDTDVGRAFCKEMEGRQYGRPEVLDAWAWFSAGWWARGKEGDLGDW